MSDTDTTIRPALSPEEWAEAFATRGHISPRHFLGIEEGQTVTRKQGHAAAALFLYGQPFGFTREDVALLRNAADTHEAESGEDWHEDVAPLRSLAARLAALLPPETP